MPTRNALLQDFLTSLSEAFKATSMPPDIGGTLYNKPNIKHAMASDDVPLLALWCLWFS